MGFREIIGLVLIELIPTAMLVYLIRQLIFMNALWWFVGAVLILAAITIGVWLSFEDDDLGFFA